MASCVWLNGLSGSVTVVTGLRHASREVRSGRWASRVEFAPVGEPPISDACAADPDGGRVRDGPRFDSYLPSRKPRALR
jgi:hypothetical protein